jgi:hypothetical protein
MRERSWTVIDGLENMVVSRRKRTGVYGVFFLFFFKFAMISLWTGRPDMGAQLSVPSSYRSPTGDIKHFYRI